MPPWIWRAVRWGAPGCFTAGSSLAGCRGGLLSPKSSTQRVGEPQHGAEQRAGADATTAHPLPGWGRKRRAGSSGTARGDEAERPPPPGTGGAEAALERNVQPGKEMIVRGKGTTGMGAWPGRSPAAPPWCCPCAAPGGTSGERPGSSDPGQAAQVGTELRVPPSPPPRCHHPATASVHPSVHPRVAPRGAPGRSWQQEEREEAEKEAAPARFTPGCQADAAQAPLSPRRHSSQQPGLGFDGRGELLGASQRAG